MTRAGFFFAAALAAMLSLAAPVAISTPAAACGINGGSGCADDMWELYVAHCINHLGHCGPYEMSGAAFGPPDRRRVNNLGGQGYGGGYGGVPQGRGYGNGQPQGYGQQGYGGYQQTQRHCFVQPYVIHNGFKSYTGPKVEVACNY